jgi:hypothetical protein
MPVCPNRPAPTSSWRSTANHCHKHHALPLTQATRYFLSYLAPAARPDQTGEAAYELLVYWHG